jgi:hydroxymethylbilane synthase
MCPAAGQGALAIEIRHDDVQSRAALAFLDHAETRAAIECERALLLGLEGGCQVPIGALAELQKGILTLTAIVGRPDGSELLRELQAGKDSGALSRMVADRLLERGADRILADVYGRETVQPEVP